MKQQLKRESNPIIYLFIAVGLSMAMSITTLILHFNTQDKIVYVNAIELISKYKGMEQAQKDLKSKSTVWQSNLDTLRSEAEKTMRDFENNKNKASAREIQLQQDLIKTKQDQFFNYEQMVKEEYQKQDKELSTNILKKINDYIKRYGEKNGYTIVLSATSYGNIAYADDALDITAEILAGINQEYATAK